MSRGALAGLLLLAGIRFDGLRASRAAEAALFVLRDVKDFVVRGAAGLPDARRDAVKAESLP